MGTEDGEIYIWNISTKQLYKKFSTHKAKVNSLNYSPDGSKLASCSIDCTLHITDINTGMMLYNKTLASPLLCLHWVDFLLLIGSQEGVLYVWDITAVKLIMEHKSHDGSIAFRYLSCTL